MGSKRSPSARSGLSLLAPSCESHYMARTMAGEKSFADLFEQEASAVPDRRPVHVGEKVSGTVLQIGKETVFVELDGKRQAFFDAQDLRRDDGTLSVATGDRIDAFVIEVDEASGVRLGRALGSARDLDAVQQAYDTGVAIEGKVTGVNRGGLEVDLGGVRAFCPISQADRGFVADPASLVGRTMRFAVTEIREGGRSVVVSHRRVLEAEARDAANRALGELTVGAIVRGAVTSVRDFGAFVDLGGIEGLVPASELAHDRTQRPADVVAVGEVLEVQVREIKQVAPKREGDSTVRITLSLKALAKDPWDALDTIAPVGRVVTGTVTRLRDFGAFVQLAGGIEGLLHVSQLAGKPDHPSRVLSVGQSVTVVVESTDRERRRISLAPAPDDATPGAVVAPTRVSVGAIVQATVERHEPYGVFVQLAGTRGRAGRGLIPDAETGLTRGSDKRKELPVGTAVTAKVLETGEGRLRLSIRAAKDDAERAEFDGWREQESSGSSLGTLGDLLAKKMKR